MVESVGRDKLELILVDVIKPRLPEGAEGLALVENLTDQRPIEKLFNTALGVPNTIYCLHGVMSRASEDDLDLALKVSIEPWKTHRMHS